MRNIKEEQQCADLFVIPQGYEVLRAAAPPTMRGDPGKAIPTLPWGVLKQPRDAIIDLRARSFEGSKNLMLSKSADMTCARPARNNFAAFPKYIPHVNLGSKRYGCHRASSASFRTPRGVTAESRERSKGMTNKLTTVLSGEKLRRSSQARDSEELRCSLCRERFEFNLPEIEGFGGILEACDNGP